MRAEYDIGLSGEVYDTPLHHQPVFSHLDDRAFPGAEWICARHVCLPLYPALTDAWERYRGTDVVLLGVVFQDSKDAARDYTARLGNTWTSALDDNGTVALGYGVFGPPETYFIGADGVIAGRHIGPTGAHMVARGIEHDEFADAVGKADRQDAARALDRQIAGAPFLLDRA